MRKRDFQEALADFWIKNYCPKNHCCLCGNLGTLDTRGKVFTPAGFECGAEVFCVCPNGQQLKKLSDKFEKKKK